MEKNKTEKPKSILFSEIIPSIMKTKKICLTTENEKEYVPFIVNRALSYHFDTVMFANEINQRYCLSNLAQYTFYINIIASKFRPFQPWMKPDKNEDIESVKAYFGYSTVKAIAALKTLTQEQKQEIRDILADVGGVVGNVHSKKHGTS